MEVSVGRPARECCIEATHNRLYAGPYEMVSDGVFAMPTTPISTDFSPMQPAVVIGTVG